MENYCLDMVSWHEEDDHLIVEDKRNGKVQKAAILQNHKRYIPPVVMA